MIPKPRRKSLLRLLGSAVIGQALLSAASLIAGLGLLRYSDEHEYGSYVLIITGVLLLSSLQAAFVGPALITRLAQISRERGRAMIAGAWREQRWMIAAATALVCAAAPIAVAAGLPVTTALLIAIGTLAGALSLQRNFFRLALQAYRYADDTLVSDALYAGVLVAGVLLAAHSGHPAIMAACALAVAALASGIQARRALQRLEGHAPLPAAGVLRELAPLGAWSAAGAAVYWTFGQGYIYLVAGMLDVTAVAAIAATRMVLMPINLLSVGISSMMLPQTTEWLQRERVPRVLQRLVLLSISITLLSLVYIGVLWLFREWVFGSVLRGSFEQRDPLLLLWSAVALVAVVRDQMMHVLVARQRLRVLSVLILISATAATGTMLLAMPHWGAPGAVAGVLVGETVNLLCIIALVCREAWMSSGSAAPAFAPAASESTG